jgi:hypothetical protein
MMRKLLVFGAALAVAASLCAADVWAPANAGQAPVATSPHSSSGKLHVTKNCKDYAGLADQHCLITSSNVKAIRTDSRVVYLQAAVGTSLDSDIILVVGPGSYALGHVKVDLSTGVGTLRLSGGSGPFRSFHARADVSPLGGADFAWDGSYHVSRTH